MLFRHRTDTTITPDTLFEAKGPFEDSRIFKILEFSGISLGNPSTVGSHTLPALRCAKAEIDFWLTL